METKQTQRFERGIQVNKVNLRLNNAELDMLESLLNEDDEDMANHIREQINKARRNN